MFRKFYENLRGHVAPAPWWCFSCAPSETSQVGCLVSLGCIMPLQPLPLFPLLNHALRIMLQVAATDCVDVGGSDDG